MSIIETVRTKCRDCYKCVRACPVKAIKVERGQHHGEFHASVVEERCIHCGTCLRECPQGAKKARRDVDRAKALLKGGRVVAASLAPSFASAFPGDPLRLVGALRSLGFTLVQETALGAEMVASAHRKLVSEGKGPYIGSACPALVSLVEKHYPEAMGYLAPLVSPAIAHGRYLKKRYPGVAVVFIGPCVAKKDEITQDSVAGSVDVALTYSELLSWLEEDGIALDDCNPASFDGPFPDRARTFAAEGGLLYSSCDGAGLFAQDAISMSGISSCMETLAAACSSGGVPNLVDLLVCQGGCISGPAAPEGPGYYEKRRRLIAYRESARPDGEAREDYARLLSLPELTRSFSDRRVALKSPTPAEIRQILEKSGKFTSADELNCGACGYGSCREKAVAVHNGLADPEMCIPFMRQRAESMANLIVSASPDGVLVTSLDGTIVDMNKAAETILGRRKKDCMGTRVSDHFDPCYFLEAARTMDSAHGPSQVGERAVDQNVLYVPDQKLLVGFMVDVTEEREEEERRRAVAEEAVARAQAIIEKQMSVAQKIAGLLGETTAETKLSLKTLMTVVREEKPSHNEPKG
ncbi:MAG: [Fe-Fe] hydrogenase large subunit C-terminal domain-containing protein [Bacillota bacterium]